VAGKMGENIMTITEYLAATILVALILWAVLGLLMQESWVTYCGRDDSKLFAPLPPNSVTKLNLALVHRAGLEPLSPRAVLQT
jgi:hypothetical protein